MYSSKCQYLGRAWDGCPEDALIGKDYCKWHQLVRYIGDSDLAGWFLLWGWMFFSMASIWVMSFVIQLWQLLSNGNINFWLAYGQISGFLYFSCLGVLFTRASGRTFWPKSMYVTQFVFSMFYLGPVVATPTLGGSFKVLDLILGSVLVLQVVSAFILQSRDYDRTPILVTLGAIILTINLRTSIWVAIPVVVLLLAFLSDIEFGWSKNRRN